jgi:hypothetical protein
MRGLLADTREEGYRDKNEIDGEKGDMKIVRFLTRQMV